MSNFKIKYEDSENIKADRVNTVVFNLHQIKRWALFRVFCDQYNFRDDDDIINYAPINQL